MTVTYEKIATTTLGSAQSTVTFSTITGSYTDLVLVANYTATVVDQGIRVRYNSDTGTNYSYRNMVGYSGGTLTQQASNVSHTRISAVSSTDSPNTVITNFINYSNTTTYKTHISRGNAVGNQSAVEAFCGTWRNTSAITNIEVYLNSGNFSTGATFTLYGILEEA